MNLLRWILLIAGAVVIAGIYLWGRRNRRTPAQGQGNIPQLDEAVVVRARVTQPPVTITSSDAAIHADGLPPMHAGGASDVDVSANRMLAPQRHEPEIFTDEPDGAAVVVTSAPREAPPVRTTAPEPTTRPPKKTPASRKIVALRLSSGSDRVEGARLKSLLEAANLRHGKYSIYHRLHSDGSPLFSVASMVEPGTFDPFAMTGVQFPGVTIFMQLPGPVEGGEMLTQMLACARELERGIGGLLQDERGMPLIEQREQRLREDVADFLHLLGPS